MEGSTATVVDRYEGVHPEEKNAKTWQAVGSILAKMHLAMATVHRLPRPVGSFAQKIRHDLTMLEYLREALKKQRKTSLAADVVYRNLPNVKRRLDTAYSFLDRVIDAEKNFPLSHATFTSQNILQIKGTMYLYGFYEPDLDYKHADTTCLIGEIFQKTRDISQVDALLAGYEEVCPLSETELIYILARLTVPRQILHYVLGYPDRFQTEEESEKIVNAFAQQNEWDQLLKTIAMRIDARRGVASDAG
jgi:Ser/Thr protein kinase RdoA (MazF antagonist)